MDSASSIAARIVKALGGRGVFGVELMINGDEVYFADVSRALRARAPGSPLRSQRLSAFELQARAILGLPVDTVMVSPGAGRAPMLRGPRRRPRRRGSPVPSVCPESDRPACSARERGPQDGAWRWPRRPRWASARDRARQVAAALNMRDSRG